MKSSIFRKLVILLCGLLLGIGGTLIVNKKLNQNIQSGDVSKMVFDNPTKTKENDKRIFLNASENTDGNTSKMAKELFGNLSYTQINLAEYTIPQIGQGKGDFDKVFNQIKDADVLVIGTPVYWSNMSGYLKTFIDHMEINNSLNGADLYLIVQGSDSNQNVALKSTYGTMNRIAKRFNMNFIGIATQETEIAKLNNILNS